jgi:hypothetical protein
MALLALARSSGTITGCTALLAWNARSHGSTIAGICEASCVSMHSKAVRCPWSSTKETASGSTSARMDWRVMLSVPAFAARFPASTGIGPVTRKRRESLRVSVVRGGASRCHRSEHKGRAHAAPRRIACLQLSPVGCRVSSVHTRSFRPSHGRVCRHMSPVARTVVPTWARRSRLIPSRRNAELTHDLELAQLIGQS